MKRKGQWSEKEDNLLVEAVKSSKYNYTYLKDELKSSYERNESKLINWDKVVSIFQGTRNVAQCRQRYLNYLSPNIRRGEFTSSEDREIIKLFKEYGSKWSKFKQSPLLQGRTVFALRTRFRTLMKKNLSKEDLLANASDRIKEIYRISEGSGILSDRDIAIIVQHNSDFHIEQNLSSTKALNTQSTEEKQNLKEAVSAILGMQKVDIPHSSSVETSVIEDKALVRKEREEPLKYTEQELKNELKDISKQLKQLEGEILFS